MTRQEYFNNIHAKLGIKWNNISLLHMALTHSSYSFEKKDRIINNQRLEFLGDAVLELVVSSYLYNQCASCSEGDLTKFRASIVCESSLARVSRDLGIGQGLYMGKGEERSGGRDRPSILADAFESLLGAIYLDSGLDIVSKFALKHLSGVISDVLEGRVERDYKTELQEILQKTSNYPVSYVILKEEGPAHDKFFTSAVVHLGKELGTGSGHSKKEAEQHAARAALGY